MNFFTHGMGLYPCSRTICCIACIAGSRKIAYSAPKGLFHKREGCGERLSCRPIGRMVHATGTHFKHMQHVPLFLPRRQNAPGTFFFPWASWCCCPGQPADSPEYVFTKAPTMTTLDPPAQLSPFCTRMGASGTAIPRPSRAAHDDIWCGHQPDTEELL